MQEKLLIKIFVSIILYLPALQLSAQDEVPVEGVHLISADTFDIDTSEIDTSAVNDSLALQMSDSMAVDTSAAGDTLSVDSSRKDKKKSAIEDPVNYKAKDSIKFDLKNNKVYLYGDAEVTYQDIELKADYIVFGMSDKVVYASGVLDSVGDLVGSPVFKDGDETFEADTLNYSFDTKKGVIRRVITEQEGGYVHGKRIKRHANEEIHIRRGKYTTCDKDHPHFYLYLTKAKVIPKDKIISGPAYMVIADIPLYVLGLPFGFFPNSKGSKSGIIIPQYGEEERRGFFLKDGGYYFALNEYMDLKLEGSYYTNRSWGINTLYRYKKRYKYNGTFEGDYYRDVYEIEDTSGLKNSFRKDIRIYWQHSQDPKANPYRRFSANVNFSTTTYDQNQTYNYNSITNNTKQSAITYNKTWPNRPFNLSANLRHSQNSRTQQFNLKVPQIQFNMARQYPFRGLSKGSKRKWYENIQVSYSAMLENNINTYDSILFNDFDRALNQMDNGFKHSVPVSMNIKAPSAVRRALPFLSSFSIVPNITYDGVMYTKWIDKRWGEYYDADADSTYETVVTERDSGLIYAQSVKPSISASLSPKLYGMYQFVGENAWIKAVRHVMTPSASISFTPDIRKYMPDYYDTVYKNNVVHPDSIMDIYSRFDNRIYGTPSLNGKSGVIGVGLRNNLEMKVLAPNDSTKDYKKVSILERFDFRSSYNMFKRGDTLKWSNISFNGGTRIINNKIDLNVSAVLNPYDYREINGRFTDVNTSYLKARDKLFRISQVTATIGVNLGDQMFRNKEDDNDKQDNNNPQEINPYDYFDLPWSLSVNYNFTRSQPYDLTTLDFIQTINLNASVEPTKYWKLSLNSGYDIVAKQITYTTASIYRDLHCWEMSLNFAPIGYRKFYFFSIKAKSPILNDLKYEKRKNWRDY